MEVTITKCTDDADAYVVRLQVTTYKKTHHQYMCISYHIFHMSGVSQGFNRAGLRLG
jgi:hypothetical protein